MTKNNKGFKIQYHNNNNNNNNNNNIIFFQIYEFCNQLSNNVNNKVKEPLYNLFYLYFWAFLSRMLPNLSELVHSSNNSIKNSVNFFECDFKLYLSLIFKWQVGDDNFGDMFIDTFKKEKVDISTYFFDLS